MKKNEKKNFLSTARILAVLFCFEGFVDASFAADESKIESGAQLILNSAELIIHSGRSLANHGTLEAIGASTVNVQGSITNKGVIDLANVSEGEITELNVKGITDTLSTLGVNSDPTANVIRLAKFSDGEYKYIDPENITSIKVTDNQYIQHYYTQEGTTYAPVIAEGSDITFSGTAGSKLGHNSSEYGTIAGGKITWHNIGEGVRPDTLATIDGVNGTNTGNRTDVTLDLDTTTGFTPTLTGGDTYVKLKNAETSGKGITFGGDASATYSFFGDNSGVKTAMDLPEANLVFGADNALFKHNDATVKNITFNGGTSSDRAVNTLSATLTAEKLTVDQYADLANGSKDMVVEGIELAGTLTMSGGTITLSAVHYE